ncbi:DoxX family protein [Shewanella algidipiscicola]|uniref:DoxD-like inner membrane protein n=1 Tax=Shewanella algidipiscicola TaxID=614070 RepID=A0ABQ4P5L9_9GAMM|nr:DoxX family protein [Shewanella algidipiscicola]GIU42749.1 DoxD-like inner membrane protein [Shewanella algidipiscicola]
MQVIRLYQQGLKGIQQLDGLVALGLRLYLTPVLMQAGYNKLTHFSDTAAWFGDPNWGLGLPMPELMVALAAGTEFFGAILLLFGLATRLVTIPLSITMLVAALSVHWQNGWLAIADPNSWLANEQVIASGEKLQAAQALLQQYGHYEWLISSGKLVVLNNGIEFAITYLLMLLALMVIGGGRYTSLDHLIAKRYQRI